MENFGGLFHGEPAKKAELDDPALLSIDRGEPGQRLVERQDIEIDRMSGMLAAIKER